MTGIISYHELIISFVSFHVSWIGLRVGSGPRTVQILAGRVGSQNLDPRATLVFNRLIYNHKMFY